MKIDFDKPDTMHPFIRAAFADYDRTLDGRRAASDITNRLYDCLRQMAKANGMDPLYEVHAWHPSQGAARGRGKCWGVSWEAGPYRWAHGVSFLIMDLTGRLAEPNYSFELCFYDVE